jgi:hypothetical protein
LEPVYGDVGNPIHLSCLVEAEPKPTISWIKNGKKVGWFSSHPLPSSSRSGGRMRISLFFGKGHFQFLA